MANRYYTIDGEAYPSITTILDILNKPQLVKWAARVTRESIKREFRAFRSAGSLEDIDLDSILAKNVTEHDRVKDDAAEFGISVHRSIASYVSKKRRIVDRSDPVIQAFHKWQDTAQFVPLASEQVVVNREHKYAGVADLIGTLNDRLAVLDIKTGRGVYPEYQLQLAASAVAWGEMSGRFPEICLNLYVKSDSIIVEANTFTGAELFSLFKTFLAAKRLFEWRLGNLSTNSSARPHHLTVPIVSNGGIQ